jgi:cobalt-zinc-cadmium efflux system protein
VGIALNTAYVIGEAIFGVLSNSLALLADAGHNLGDVMSLALAWLATWLVKRAPSARYTYGLRGSSILAALSNAVVLLVVTGGIAWAAVVKLVHPSPAGGAIMVGVALVGVAVNAVTAWMFASGRKGDVNIRAAFSHMAADALVALGVAVAGVAVILTGWTWLDPAVSLIIGGVVVMGTWSLMRESLDLALHAVPPSVDEAGVRAYHEHHRDRPYRTPRPPRSGSGRLLNPPGLRGAEEPLLRPPHHASDRSRPSLPIRQPRGGVRESKTFIRRLRRLRRLRPGHADASRALRRRP